MAVKTDKDALEQTGMLIPVPDEEKIFGGEGVALSIGTEVQEAQLISEMYAHLGDREAFEVVVTEGVDGVKTVHVLGEVGLDVVKTVVEAHTPDPDFGLDERARTFRDLRARLKLDENLTLEELNELLRAML